MKVHANELVVKEQERQKNVQRGRYSESGMKRQDGPLIVGIPMEEDLRKSADTLVLGFNQADYCSSVVCLDTVNWRDW